MEEAVKVAVFEMFCNLKGQGFLGKDSVQHANTLAAISREIETQTDTFEWGKR